MTVAKAIYESIRSQGVSHVFCVPGESYLAVMDAFHASNSPALVATRHEEGAGLMAEAYAKATGKPGVCMVTRGPGITHLSIALHTALQDSTPLVVVVGQVPASVRYREAFQEMDLIAFATPLCKWAVEICSADRTAELMQKAFHVARSGRPGPVLVSLPEDIDRASVESRPARTARTFAAHPSAEGIRAAAELLQSAERPCIVAGGGITRDGATAELVRLAEALCAPVYTGWRRFDAFPNNHPLYLGPLPVVPKSLTAPLFEADVVLAIGTRLGEFTTNAYSWPTPQQKLLHVDVSPEEAGNGWAGADIALVSDCRSALQSLGDAVAAVHDRPARTEAVRKQRALYVQQTTARPLAPEAAAAQQHRLDLEGVYHDVLRMLPDTASISCDAGTFGGWLMRYYRWNHPRTLFAPTAGGMGYALPAAIGAKTARPDQPSIAFAGDGGFAMTMCEIETAVRLGLKSLVALVFNNSNYGTIRVHQQREFPERPVATQLGDVDFAKTAESMGAMGATVRTNAEFRSAFARALAADRPAVINLVYSAEVTAPWSDERPR